MRYAEVMRARAERRALGVMLAALTGCGTSSTSSGEDPLVPPGRAAAASVDEQDRDEPARAPAIAEAELEPEPGPPPLPAPVETRVSARTLAIYDATERTREHLRGQIPRWSAFHVYALREGPNCRGGQWGQVGREAWVCLDHTERSDEVPATLPVLGEDRLVPYVYARPRREYRSSGQPIPRYRSRKAFNDGEAAIDELPAHGQYAFVRKRFNGGEAVYEDSKRRAVPGKYLWAFAPSDFSGHDLEANPLPAGADLAWVIEREGATVRAKADPAAAEASTLGYHGELYVRAGTSHEDEWLEVIDARGDTLGFVDNREVGLWTAPPVRADAGADEIWVDVELDEQVLTVMRGDAPVFATLVSSGKPGHRTPPGTFRVNRKKAWGAMQSRDDEPEPYYVEAVPWSQYYFEGFAIHAAYWHDGFGTRRSHGCVNLSPSDARRVFSMTGPHLEAGWIVAYEHEVDPGATIRVRRGADQGEDRRTPIAPPSDDDPGTDADEDVDAD